MTTLNRLARLGLGATAGFLVLGVAMALSQAWPTGLAPVIYGSIALVFAVVGWLIVERASGNAIGLALLVTGLIFGAYSPADLYIRLPGNPAGADMLAVMINSLDAPSLGVIALALILFPDGRLPSRRWSFAPFLTLVVALSAIAGLWLFDGPVPLYPQYRSPLGIPGLPIDLLVLVAYVGMFILLAAAVAALLVRWRRGAVVERAQIKWIVAAAIAVLVTEAVNVATFTSTSIYELSGILASAGISLIPIAIGIAILRYRLFEIDRLISRTIAYAVVTGVLVVSFALGLIALQAVLDGVTQGETLAVAASTLMAFALFQPLRRRVQQVVDRRFNRARYDAQRMATAFAGRLRHQLDLPMLTEELRRATAESVEPHAAAVWLRPRATR